MPKKITLTLFALALLLSTSAACDARAELMPSIQIKDLTKGVRIEKRTRLIVEDIRIGETSVKELFSNSDSNEVSDEDYLSRKQETITLKVKDRRFLSRFNYLILTSEPAYLIVQLVDPRKGSSASRVVRWFRRTLYFFLGDSDSKQLKYPVSINLSPCDRLTQIIFHGMHTQIDDKITEITTAGQTEASVSLEHLFLLLRSNRLDAFMRKLGPIERTCPGAFRLLSWARDEEVYGFEFKRYAVTPELGSVFDAISKSIAQYKSWQRYDFKISVVGYTDSTAVMKPEQSKFLLDPARTGVRSLTSRPRLEVHYRNCLGDHTIDGAPQYIDFFRPSGGQLVRSIIETNCELGAVRAYSATASLVERLGRKNMQYEYATGGISPTGSADDLKRKVDLKIVVKAATKQ